MNPAARLCAAVVLLVTTLISAFASVASGGESSDDLKARMNEIQAELDATTARIEDLRSKEDALKLRVAQTTTRIASVQEKKRRMMGRVVEAAQELYKSGSLGARTCKAPGPLQRRGSSSAASSVGRRRCASWSELSAV